MTKEKTKNILFDIFNRRINKCHIIMLTNDDSRDILFRILGNKDNIEVLNTLIQKDILLKEVLNPIECKQYNKDYSYIDCDMKKQDSKKLFRNLAYLKMYFC